MKNNLPVNKSLKKPIIFFFFFLGIALVTLGIIWSRYTKEEKTFAHAEVAMGTWNSTGISLIDEQQLYQSDFRTVPDGEGGFIISWWNPVSGVYGNMYAQRFDSTGNAMWGSGGIEIATMVDGSIELWSTGGWTLRSIGNNEYIAAWQDDHDTYTNLHIQKFNNSGQLQWQQDGITIVEETGETGYLIGNFPDIISDGSNGMIIGWIDMRARGEYEICSDIYTQRVDSSGNTLWAENGVRIYDGCGDSENQSNAGFPILISDGSNGAFVYFGAWYDVEPYPSSVIVQRVNSSGEGLFGIDNNGVTVATSIAGERVEPFSGDKTSMISDSLNGTIVCYTREDQSENEFSLSLQRINSSGELQWGENGIMISDSLDNPGGGGGGEIASDKENGVIAMWSEKVDYSEDFGQIFSQRFNSLGEKLWTESGIPISSQEENILCTNPSISEYDSNSVCITWNNCSGDFENYLYNCTTNAQWVDKYGNIKWKIGGSQVVTAPYSSSEEIEPWNMLSPQLIKTDTHKAVLIWSDKRSDPYGDWEARKVYAQKIERAFQISNLDTNLNATDPEENNIEVGSDYGLIDTSTVTIESTSNIIIAEVEVDVSSQTDLDWPDVSGDTNITSGKSFIINLDSAPGASSTHTLYVPIPAGEESNSLIICPSATSLSEVHENCSGAIQKTEQDSDTSKVEIQEQNYWKVENLTTSGGISILEETEEHYCGDGTLDDGEECDDGNLINGDGCSSTCTIEAEEESYCGDGTLDAGEECDDGNQVSGDGCSSTCTIEAEEEGYCGDGTLDAGEECDDGNLVPGDGCSSTCTIETEEVSRCGNGILEAGEECDDGNTDDTDRCSNACKINDSGRNLTGYCGDNKVQDNEQCDDGNLISGDGCSAFCTTEIFIYCGNGILDEDEDCDDGNQVNGDGCSNICRIEIDNEYCGDSVQQDDEECDDGNQVSGDGCTNVCTLETDDEYCGDGTKQETEECDDGNQNSGDGCSIICEIEPYTYCGDCEIYDPEECDDCNVTSGDGCSSKCKKEGVDEILPPDTGEEEQLSFIDIITNFIKELRDNKIITFVTKYIGTIIAILPITGNMISIVFSTIFVAPLNLFLAFLALVKREKKNHWGIIYDRERNKPIPFAVIRLKNEEGNVQTKVSDLAGRYSLFSTPGKFILKVQHNEYKTYETKLTIDKNNKISIDPNIALEPKKMGSLMKAIVSIREFIDLLFKNYGYFLLLAGFYIALFVWLIIPTTFNLIIVLIYIPLFIIYHRGKVQYPRNWSRVVDSSTRKIVEGAFVKIFKEEKGGPKLLDTSMTDSSGRFGFVLDKSGEYLLLIAAANYKFPSHKNKFPTFFHESLIKVKIGKNKVFTEDLYVDPVKQKKSKVVSPFSG